MQKTWFMIVCCTLLITLILASGCTQQQQAPSEETLQQILSKGENVTQVYTEVDSVTAIMGQNLTSTVKLWQKLPYMKIEMSMINPYGGQTITTTYIMRPEGIYVYNSSQMTYVKMNNTPAPQQSFKEQIADMKRNPTLHEVGTDTIDGKAATIIEFTNNTAMFNITEQLWMWNEKGIPLKAVITEGMGSFVTTVTMTYKNFSFDAIPDSTFSVT